MKRENQCAFCQSKIEIGLNCWAAQQGVMGSKRFIPLENQTIFCSEECIHKHFNGAIRYRGRIP